MSQDDLDLISTDELVDELRRRNVGTIIGLYAERTEDSTEAVVYWSGGRILALGILRDIEQRLLNHKTTKS